jgi:hypothetical protein
VTVRPLSAQDIESLSGDLADELVRFFEAPGLVVDIASAEYLLAMKHFASRAETDADDIALLYRHQGHTTVDRGLDLVERAYPGRPPPARIRFLLEDVVANLDT